VLLRRKRQSKGLFDAGEDDGGPGAKDAPQRFDVLADEPVQMLRVPAADFQQKIEIPRDVMALLNLRCFCR
jgi:hypothetical protein